MQAVAINMVDPFKHKVQMHPPEEQDSSTTLLLHRRIHPTTLIDGQQVHHQKDRTRNLTSPAAAAKYGFMQA